ncbi:unnamed protein product [Rangifer tarandus platyrhynchus]|uniref:Uncharacterized protein n=1 Tax=Rangifer tarandus platyrhynchus TaxID=3082113 RepID=A0ABN8Y9W0_RANTA|nr:unnamed protein product [Rangifer tarandus platyrhynchus]
MCLRPGAAALGAAEPGTSHPEERPLHPGPRSSQRPPPPHCPSAPWVGVFRTVSCSGGSASVLGPAGSTPPLGIPGRWTIRLPQRLVQVTQMPAVREMDAETPCGVVRPPLQEGPPGASGGEQGQPEHLAKHVEERQVCSVHLPSLPVTRGPSPPFPQAPPRASWGPGGIPEVVLPLSRCECYSLCLLPPLGPPALLLGLHFPLGPACSTPTVSLLVAEGRALLTTGLASATAQTLPLPGRSSPDPPQRGACPPAPTPPRNPINLCETSYRSAVWTHWKRLTSKYFILPFCTLAGSPERGSRGIAGTPEGRRKSGTVRKDLLPTGDPGPPQQPPRGPRIHFASNILVLRPDGCDSQCPEDKMTVQLPGMCS